jgi:hypothetical protein
MAKFTNAPPVRPPRSPVQTATVTPDTFTHEGAPAHSFTQQSELFLLAVTNMVGEDTFYESASTRDRRFNELVTSLARSDPAWLAGFIPWLRRSANMRSASVVALAEYVHAGGPNARALIASTLARMDEPGELLGYWMSHYGRNIPKPIKRGIGDYLTGSLNEYGALKYDGLSNAIRLGDVVELVHPRPANNAQSHLFKYLLDRRHQGKAKVDGRVLKTIKSRELLEAIPAEQRRAYLAHETWGDVTGATWEWLSGWLPGGMDAKAWEAIIPSMGYMALLRNLRNFDQADISIGATSAVQAILSSPDAVARSRQFPYRFWSAYKNTHTVTWTKTLEKALALSLSNVPTFTGRTLVLCDVSGSMNGPVSNNSTIRRYEVAGVFAAAVAARSDATLALFASSGKNLNSVKGHSVLRTVEVIRNEVGGSMGYGTLVSKGLKYYTGEDRIVVFTDEQSHDRPTWPSVPVYIFNLGGYAQGMAASGDNVHRLGGFSDSVFRMIPLLEAHRGGATWPWMEGNT